MEQPKQTPLLDLLRGVPKDGRVMYEWESTAHQNIPYGYLCHDAADEIEKLRQQRDELVAALEIVGSMATWLDQKDEIVDLANTAIAKCKEES